MTTFLIILSIIVIFIGIVALNCMQENILKNFENSCKESVRKKDENLEKEEQLNENLKKILF